MNSDSETGNTIVVQDKEQITKAMMLTQRRALELEVFTKLRHSRGCSMMRQVKTWYRLTGNPQTVFRKFVILTNERTGVPFRPALPACKEYFTKYPLTT